VRITVLAGGVGGAKFLLGVKAFLGWEPTGPAPVDATDEITAIVNTGDDIRLHNLQICPDLDSCLYTLSGAADTERGWGRAGETWAVSAELAAYGAEAPWFSLGDKDIATHLVRTRMLDAGYPLSSVTEALCDRWSPGVRLLPMTDGRVETHVVVVDPERSAAVGGGLGSDTRPDDGRAPSLIALHFQEWWIRYRAAIPALSITPIGAADVDPAPGVLEAIAEADLVLIAPSNPVVSIGTTLAIPGVRRAVVDAPAPVVGFSPIIGGAPVRGHADSCLAAIGVECSAQGVAAHYGARSRGGLLDAFLIAEGDAAAVDGLAIAGAPLLMTDPGATAAMIAAGLELVDVRR
jgi:LPPG:FO 2-phospho-L-lactate transferase